MGVPEEIRRVARPRNTVVVLSGSKGAKRYAVRERLGFKYGASGNPQPINGRIIGHIVDGLYVPLHANVSAAEPDMLSYGASAFIRSCSNDLLQDLYAVYSVTDAQRIMAIASLRVLKPKIAAHRISTEYHRSFICKYYPDLALSANTVSSFLQKLGEDGTKRKAFISAASTSWRPPIMLLLTERSSRIQAPSMISRPSRERHA